MNWFDIIVVILLIFSFLGGLKDGAVKSLSSLIALLIAIPVTTFAYRLLASVLSFLPGENWENFLGFFITLGIIIVILHVIFFIPRKLIGAIWIEGILFRLIGGIINLIGAIIGMAVFALVIQTYPIFDWLANWVNNSNVLAALTDAFGFIRFMLPKEIRTTLQMVRLLSSI